MFGLHKNMKQSLKVCFMPKTSELATDFSLEVNWVVYSLLGHLVASLNILL